MYKSGNFHFGEKGKFLRWVDISKAIGRSLQEKCQKNQTF
jgi:hypothetical protein